MKIWIKIIIQIWKSICVFIRIFILTKSKNITIRNSHILRTVHNKFSRIYIGSISNFCTINIDFSIKTVYINSTSKRYHTPELFIIIPCIDILSNHRIIDISIKSIKYCKFTILNLYRFIRFCFTINTNTK